MNGLLQRLAARATGSAWTVRSDARLPFAGAPGIVQAQAVEPSEPAAAPRPAQASAGPAAIAQQAVPPAAEPAHGASPPAARTRQMAAAQDSATTAPRPEQKPAAAIHAEADPAGPPGLDDMAHTTETVAAPTAARHIPPAHAQGPAAHADPAPLLPAGKAPEAAPTPHVRAAAAHPGTPRAPHALPPPWTPSPTQAAPAEPAEVHVHIGRIEVTAIAQPQPPRRAARERAQPLSLDAYLARRKEPS
ncbi:hypothetical protein [Diaphorobacter sp.]|uniref:hypothetical protein n=1 Tax=Comamonadaceae TaxID=80864 RepID=UPI002587CEF4|nr:hypothetical protein [Diaphorobacter sp.]